MRPGDRVGKKYEILRALAIGGMGEVWLAKNENTRGNVVLKILNRDFSGRATFKERFRHEAYVGAVLSHPGVARVFDLLEEPNGDLVLVMEYVYGETLRAVMRRRGPLPVGEAVAIGCEVLRALAHAHEKGVVHRDVKPTNIALEKDDQKRARPKILDFGIARSEGGNKTETGEVLGTPRYMSPEQIRAEPIDGRSDLFSLAVVLVECLTGESPFAAKSPSASLAAVLENPVDRDPSIPFDVWLVLQTALSKRPYERFENADAFRKALEEACEKSKIALELPEIIPQSDIFETSESHQPIARVGSELPTQAEDLLGNASVPPVETLRIPRTKSAMVGAGMVLVVLFGVGLRAAILSRPETKAAAHAARESQVPVEVERKIPPPDVDLDAPSSSSTTPAPSVSSEASRSTRASDERPVPAPTAVVNPRPKSTSVSPALAVKKRNVATKPDF